MVAVAYPSRADDSACRAPSAVCRKALGSVAVAAALAGR